ncbi:hypothetical protein [Amycolatopsis sp. NPDC004169]|uniref:hypothetical protein n=1 Tax=Amycolatopsis sp. NPDC004169 TaxID=3154453 RepID=UPI0033BE2907
MREIAAPELLSRRWTFATHDDGVVNSGLDITFFESPPGAAVTPAVPAPPAPVPGARFTTNIVNAADAALRSGAAGCAGLYRTTLLSHEKFGAGRPDVRTTLRAGRISFRCLVEEVTTA